WRDAGHRHQAEHDVQQRFELAQLSEFAYQRSSGGVERRRRFCAWRVEGRRRFYFSACQERSGAAMPLYGLPKTKRYFAL
ncbi:MAG: hypothetical protein ABIW33_08655, partial [Sphingomicrobium sp.]